MVDVIPVFDTDYQCSDANGDPVSGGTVEFYNAGTSTPRAVYSDPALATSLGAVVSLNADGRPVSGATLVTIYTGVNAFKFIVKDQFGAILRTRDNQPGAFDTSGFAESSDVSGLGTGVVATQTLSADVAAVAADEGHILNVNPSGGVKTITLPSAVTVGDAWPITIRHDGTANSVKIATVAGQKIQHAGPDAESISLLERGESITLVSDATSWLVASHSVGGIVSTAPAIVVEAVQSSPPVSPTPGQTYIIGSTPSGGWSARLEHDVARWSGGEWLYWTPATDAGWTAYNRATKSSYQFQDSAWVERAGTVGTGLVQTLGAMAVDFATAADMEAWTETDKSVVPALQQRHALHPKAWIEFTSVTTTAISGDTGVSAITDDGAGRTTVAFDTAFSSTAYAAAGMSGAPGNPPIILSQASDSAKTATTFQVVSSQTNTTLSVADAPRQCIVFLGDQ